MQIRTVTFVKASNKFVFGVYETSQLLRNLSIAFPDSRVIDFAYRGSFSDLISNSLILSIKTAIEDAYTFASLILSHNIFVYVGPHGFLLSKNLTRRIESRILKLSGKRFISIAVGSDIRSIHKSIIIANARKEENLGTLMSKVLPPHVLRRNEKIYRSRARTMDKYSSLIFSLSFDQVSYLKSKTEPFLYFYPRDKMNYLPNKFDKGARIKILHAPSNSLLKGSSSVISAIKNLESDGYEFDFELITNCPNELVLKSMSSSHIFINEFYSYGLGMASIEAMANTCALITRCNPLVETDHGLSAVDAWIPCEKEDLESTLSTLLTNTELLKNTALRGYQWVYAEQSDVQCRERFLNSLQEKKLL
jgi:hypothetical protein